MRIPNLLLENWLLLVLILWSIPWKGYALWKAAKRSDRGWFIAFLVLNTVALLEAFYIFHVSERDGASQEEKPKAEESKHNLA